MEIPRGRGVLEAKLLEEKYEATGKLEFPGVRGSITKSLPFFFLGGGGEHGYFLELHNDLRVVPIVFF